MTSTEPERFRNELLSITTANPGWRVQVRHVACDVDTEERAISHEATFPVVAWGVVRAWFFTGGEETRTDPIFLTDVGLTHASEYRRVHSALDPGSDPQTTIDITVLPPVQEALFA